MIARSLEHRGWTKSRAAIDLGISRQGLIKKIKRLQLVRPSAEPTTRAAGWQQLMLPFTEEDDVRTLGVVEPAAVAAD